MTREVKKRVAVILIVALCAGMGSNMGREVPVKAASYSSAESEIDNKKTNWWTPTDSWEKEEVVTRLDDNNTDENGYIYKLKVRGSAYTAELTKIEVTRYKDAKEDIVIRVPDRVEKDGVKYDVTQCTLYPNDLNFYLNRKFHLYVGEKIQKIYCGEFRYALVSYVHSANENYVSRDGILFTRDETTLVRFGKEKWDPERIYILPESVESMDCGAFVRADVKEVVLNEKITELPWRAFYNSCIQRIDLKNVIKISRYVFLGCEALKEVKINCRGIQIEEMAFADSGIENLYIPPDAVLAGMCIIDQCRELKTVVMDEGAKILAESEFVGGIGGSSNHSVFASDIHLKTLVMPEGTKEIGAEYFRMCCMLRKLYVPDSVESIQSFHTQGEFTLYGRNEDVMDSYEGNAAFVNLSGHEHMMKEVTFFEQDSWGVRGRYCEECGYGCDIEFVEYDEGYKKEEMPELLCVSETEEEGCPEELELDEVNRDRQGVVYQLDNGSGTAKVVDFDETFNRGFIALPEKVGKNGKTYVLETIGSYALGSLSGVVLVSDSVKNIEQYALMNATDIVLGKNVSSIKEGAFCNVRGKVCVPEDNVNFKVIENAIYTADGKELIIYCGSMLQRELVIPAGIEKIWSRAFYSGSWLETIYIYATDGKFKKDIFPLRTEIIYMGKTGESGGDEVPENTELPETVDLTPEPKETASPDLTPEPEETTSPSLTPEPEETASPSLTLEPKETASPSLTPEPEETTSPSLTPEPEETVGPGLTPEPEETTSPSLTPEPKETTSPSLTPEPEETASPSLTPEPEETVGPSLTPEPEETANLESTDLLLISNSISEMVVQTVQSYISPSNDSVEFVGARQNLRIRGFRILTMDHRSVMLRWQANEDAKYYCIYRANQKNGIYKQIQAVGKSKHSYTDKRIKPNKRYYYKVVAVSGSNGKVTKGNSSVIRSIYVPGIAVPKITVTKGQIDSIRYVTVVLKKYQGKYVDIQISYTGKNYKPLKLISHNIARYRGKFKIRYMVKKKTIYFKARTCPKKDGKEYSGFSKVIKVRV